MNQFDTVSAASCFFLSDGESQIQNKAKNAYARVIMVIMQ